MAVAFHNNLAPSFRLDATFLFNKTYIGNKKSVPFPPSDQGMHAPSGEFTSASCVVVASGGVRTHMAVDAVFTPQTFFTYRTEVSSANEGIDAGVEMEALTFQNRPAGIVPSVFAESFHLIVG